MLTRSFSGRNPQKAPAVVKRFEHLHLQSQPTTIIYFISIQPSNVIHMSVTIENEGIHHNGQYQILSKLPQPRNLSGAPGLLLVSGECCHELSQPSGFVAT